MYFLCSLICLILQSDRLNCGFTVWHNILLIFMEDLSNSTVESEKGKRACPDDTESAGGSGELKSVARMNSNYTDACLYR